MSDPGGAGAAGGAGVVVTGASSGIGRACALALAHRGFHVLAGVRREEDAPAVLDASQGAVTPLLLDVTDGGQVAAAAARAEGLLGGSPLAAVVNNAGTMVSGPLEQVRLDDVRRQLEVNVVGPLAVVQSFLPLLRRSSGRVVMIGSSSGRLAGRFVGPYAASKAALDVLTSTLRLELADSGVGVSLVEPGVVATRLWVREEAAQRRWMQELGEEASRRYAARATRRQHKLAGLHEHGLDPAAVAAVVVDAVTVPRPKPRYVVGRDARVRAALGRFLPERVLIRVQTR